MVYYKTDEQLALIQEGGVILGKAHAEVAKLIKPGVKTLALDKVAFDYISDHGGKPSFKDYKGFKHSLCISKNDEVVHGIPGSYELKEGDIVSIDCGVFYKGFHSDSAYTYPVGQIPASSKRLLDVTKDSLEKGIQRMVAGARLGDVSFAIQSYVEQNGFSIVRELVGHGVGKSLHEKPEVPNYGKAGKGIKLLDGIVLAIEPMVNMGKKDVVQERDGWTIRTKDRLPSAHFEHTVAIKEGKPLVLTTFKYIEEVLLNG